MNKENLSNAEKNTSSRVEKCKVVMKALLIISISALAIVIYTSPLRDLGLVAIKSDTEKGMVHFDFGDPSIQERLNRIAEENMFCVFMNTNPVFKNGYSKGNLMIQNIEQNGKPVYVEIVRDDTEEVIYRSMEILPGYKVENSKLAKKLSKGEYPCTAYFNVLDAETRDIINTIGLKLNLKVES